MEIFNYEIKLKSVHEDDLELLRTWRNSNFVNSNMIFTKYITSEMHQKWYKSVDNELNYYFIAVFKEEKIGVIHVKNIKNNSGEGGIYLSSNKYENTDLVARMVLCFNDFIFENLKLNHIYSKVKRDNKKAVASSLAQGCVENLKNSTNDVIEFNLYPENYYFKTKKIRKILSSK